MSERSRLLLRKKLRLVAGVSLVFMILGIGNLFIGRTRAASYQSLIIQSQNIETSTSQTTSLQRLKARLDFYRIVELGGKCFLVISGFLLLWYLLLLRDDEDQITVTNHTI